MAPEYLKEMLNIQRGRYTLRLTSFKFHFHLNNNISLVAFTILFAIKKFLKRYSCSGYLDTQGKNRSYFLEKPWRADEPSTPYSKEWLTYCRNSLIHHIFLKSIFVS